MNGSSQHSALAKLRKAAKKPELDAVFAALADPTRRDILVRLAVGDAGVTELAAPFSISQPAVTKHLKVLERAGLVSRRKDAQRRPVRANPRRISEAITWLELYERVWEENFARLDGVVADLETKNKSG